MEESCNKFVMADDNHGLDIPPLKDKHVSPPPSEPPDKRQQICNMNTMPNFDEYAVDNSEDERDGDNHSLEEVDTNDESSEALIEAFSPYNG
ncbi:hypothetical protein EJD97_023360 [Solanum chilense]|uniref:Uncharacterized protein n=1 Tax=Solanum chilense TaxID=4083 RepID=A0A6N2C5T6_SOLCI|nr:hypothetical protein EJD97_023360 [Solanum chilense]